mmetsp:Transcript_35248/g.85452  ORF Transcript_35248/g.85452 Transcript_35248/m.85452 type:complete len:142 (-) Transcript_35248:28-453(-)
MFGFKHDQRRYYGLQAGDVHWIGSPPIPEGHFRCDVFPSSSTPLVMGNEKETPQRINRALSYREAGPKSIGTGPNHPTRTPQDLSTSSVATTTTTITDAATDGAESNKRFRYMTAAARKWIAKNVLQARSPSKWSSRNSNN